MVWKLSVRNEANILNELSKSGIFLSAIQLYLACRLFPTKTYRNFRDVNTVAMVRALATIPNTQRIMTVEADKMTPT